MLTVGNSLFDVKDSIWTFNCPCPSPPEEHSRHVCRFKHSPAASHLSYQFDALYQFFYVTPRRCLSSSVTTEIDTCITATTTELETLLEQNSLQLMTTQCFHRNHCHNENCRFAHSIEDLLCVFREKQVRHFYSQLAHIKDQSYRPHTVTLDLNDYSKFTHCPGAYVETKLVYHTGDTLLVYPYIVMRCEQCNRITNTAVYR